MQKRKKSGSGGANWQDTYGDMVTLLLCFFVLLYSMSTISEENWKALVMSFNPDALQTLTETSGNDGPNADPNEEDGSGLGLSQEKIDEDMQELYDALVAYTQQAGMQNSISVTEGDGRVYVTFNQSVFFDGDEWELREESIPILQSVADMLSQASEAIDEVRMLGHTAQARPDSPNDPVVDRVLSAERAANALAYIQEHSTLDPARLISEGYGQWRPIASNDTAEGRARNRRVEMIVSGRNLEQELEDGLQQYQTGDTSGVSGTGGTVSQTTNE